MSRAWPLQYPPTSLTSLPFVMDVAGNVASLATRVSWLMSWREMNRGEGGRKGGKEDRRGETPVRETETRGDILAVRGALGEAPYAPISRPDAVAVEGPAACLFDAGALFHDR